MLRYLTILAICITFPVLVHAGDESTLIFIGFSQNGEYLAFEQYGWQDGSGFPYSEIVFVDVVKNDFARNPISVVLEEEEWEQSASDRALELAQETLDELGIISGNTGYLIVTLPRGEPDIDPHTVYFSEAGVPLDTLGNYFRSVVTLKEIEVSDANDFPDAWGSPKLLDLRISIPDLQEEQILQKDAQLPGRRANAIEYGISDVYLYRYAGLTYVAVFIWYMMPGFEGPDIRYMVVTGQIKF